MGEKVGRIYLNLERFEARELNRPWCWSFSSVRSSPRRQDCDHFHFEQIARVGQARNLQQRRGRQRRLVRKIGRAHFAVDRAVLIQVGQVVKRSRSASVLKKSECSLATTARQISAWRGVNVAGGSGRLPNCPSMTTAPRSPADLRPRFAIRPLQRRASRKRLHRTIDRRLLLRLHDLDRHR
jgi:hypothetical protein